VFKCWNTKKDGTGFSYDSGASYTREAAATLYAQWEEMTLKELPAASREGYVFDGWYTKDGELITSNRTIMVSQTFYAKWTDEETYNAVIDFVTRLYKMVCRTGAV
ncbi:MAG: InlB B-repeat-containing protein, partial [Peptococcaceae bacterium]|nr:InlB B-repeat-containing protein [Peptococcaceae bacterium]